MKYLIDFTLPAFIQYGEYYYKIIDETKLLTVVNYDFNKEIRYQNLTQCNPFGNWGWNLITEQQFNEIFIKIYSELEELLPKTIIEDCHD